MLRKGEFWAPVIFWIGLGLVGFVITGILIILTEARGVTISSSYAFTWIGPATLELVLMAFASAALIWRVKIRNRRLRVLFGAVTGLLSPSILFLVLFVLKQLPIGAESTRSGVIEALGWTLLFGFIAASVSGLAAGAYAAFSWSRIPPEHAIPNKWSRVTSP